MTTATICGNSVDRRAETLFTEDMTNTASAGERKALTELVKLSIEARGDHPALADVRRQIFARIDDCCANLASYGIDTDALLDEIDAELDGEA